MRHFSLPIWSLDRGARQNLPLATQIAIVKGEMKVLRGKGFHNSTNLKFKTISNNFMLLCFPKHMRHRNVCTSGSVFISITEVHSNFTEVALLTYYKYRHTKECSKWYGKISLKSQLAMTPSLTSQHGMWGPISCQNFFLKLTKVINIPNLVTCRVTLATDRGKQTQGAPRRLNKQ